MDNTVPLEIYQKEMREMQREVNYLRKRVATLNDIIVDLQNHTTSSVEYYRMQSMICRWTWISDNIFIIRKLYLMAL